MKDMHIHLNYDKCDSPKIFMEKTAEAGVDGGTIFSQSPEGYWKRPEVDQSYQARIDRILSFTSETPGFLPFLWIDPLASDIMEQIAYAKEKGIKGFKIICTTYYPKQILKTMEAIAQAKMPVSFHSGIIWNREPSSEYNRPVNFEPLMDVKDCRFSLAHIGWPWVDEFVALYGKFNYVHEAARESTFEMFVDLTPGTPVIYRKDALKKVYLCNYPIKNNVLWGSDCVANDYSVKWAKDWLAIDRELMQKVVDKAPKLGMEHLIPENIFELSVEDNFKRFNNL